MSFGQAGCSLRPSMMSGSPDLSKSTKLDLATDNGTRATRRKLSLILRSSSSDQFLVDMERAEVGGMVGIASLLNWQVYGESTGQNYITSGLHDPSTPSRTRRDGRWPRLTMSNASAPQSSSFDFWEFVACGTCQLPFISTSTSGPTIPFWLTECGHIVCNNHLSAPFSCLWMIPT